MLKFGGHKILKRKIQNFRRSGGAPHGTNKKVYILVLYLPKSHWLEANSQNERGAKLTRKQGVLGFFNLKSY